MGRMPLRVLAAVFLACWTMRGIGDGAGAARAADPPAGPRPNVIVAIADDWSFPHASIYGDKVVRTPAFDRVAREGVLFNHAYCASPSCTPSRGGILTGQAVHRLENGGNLWSILPSKFACYPDLLEAEGYAVGETGKGWGPGTLAGSGRSRNPAGPSFKDFRAFLKTVPAGKPFVYWYGSTDPHRPYEAGTGAASGMKAADVAVPPFFPDTPTVRSDILDYYFEVQRFDHAVGDILRALDESGLAENTLLVVTSDNGMPFPRSKANLYDSGTRMPMAIRWPSRLPRGKTVDAFVSHRDLAPTFLDAAGLKPLPEMTGESLLPVMLADAPIAADGRDSVFLERERHAHVREGNLSYPSRAIRTSDYLYIRNLRPSRWPGGDPVLVESVGPYGDCDASPTKEQIIGGREEPALRRFFPLSFAKRPAEELYDLKSDPNQVHNLAGDPGHASAQAKLRARLDRWMTGSADPLALDKGDGPEPFDAYPYVGPPAAKPKGRAK